MKKVLFILLAMIGVATASLNAQKCCTTAQEICNPANCCPTVVDCCEVNTSNSNEEEQVNKSTEDATDIVINAIKSDDIIENRKTKNDEK